ncbi:MAG: response regulator [Candidatus Sumerlaeaceae bacterium]|nr:response regulator [Candidatus Sumerlaeaceae bacterium]
MEFPFFKRDKTGRLNRRLAVVVDDEPDVCQIVQATLEGAGFGVRTAHDGVAGLETVRSTHPQVIVLDIKMPRMNGYEMLAALRADPRTKDIPVVVMTSLTDPSEKTDEQWRESLGVAGFLSKPFDPADLLAAVRQAVGD